MDDRRMRTQLRWLQFHALASTLLLGWLALRALGSVEAEEHVLRARGIVIEDEQGRDRILIGAPVPNSPDRVRTDLERVRKEWAPSLGGDAYMERYASYRHAASGILFLNEDGFDRLVLGERHPDPNTGQRIVAPAGLTFNDERGFERGGLGISKTATGETRVVLGMDDPDVGEALHLFVLEDGTKGVRIAYEGGQIFLGRARPANPVTGGDKEFSGLLVTDAQGRVLLEQNALERR